MVGRWLGLKEPMHSGRSAIRGLAVYPQGHGLKHAVQMLVDGGTRAAMVPMNDKDVYWFSAYASYEDTSTKTCGIYAKEYTGGFGAFPFDIFKTLFATLIWQLYHGLL